MIRATDCRHRPCCRVCRPGLRAADDRRLPGAAGRQHLEHAGGHAAGAGQLGDDGQHDRREPRLPRGLRRRHVGRRPHRHPVHHRARHADEVPGVVPLRRRERPGAVRGAAERADRGRRQRHRRSPCDCRRHHQLHPLRALSRVPAGLVVDRRLGRHLRSALERAAAAHVDVGRRRRAADHAGPRHRGRSAERRDPPRHPLHGAADAPRVRVARAALRVVAHRHAVSAHGRALPPEGVVRHLAVSRRRAGHPAGDEEIRHHPRRQRVGLVHLRASRIRAGTTTTSTRCRSSSARTSRRSMPPCSASARTREPRGRTAPP